MTGADMDCSAYLGDEWYGVYVDVIETPTGWLAVFTVDGEHFTESLSDLGPYPTRREAAEAGAWHAIEIASANGVELSYADANEAIKFLMTE